MEAKSNPGKGSRPGGKPLPYSGGGFGLYGPGGTRPDRDSVSIDFYYGVPAVSARWVGKSEVAKWPSSSTGAVLRVKYTNVEAYGTGLGSVPGEDDCWQHPDAAKPFVHIDNLDTAWWYYSPKSNVTRVHCYMAATPNVLVLDIGVKKQEPFMITSIAEPNGWSADYPDSKLMGTARIEFKPKK